ncbi:23S rRNA pseudouridine(1911/1915/1917) synthase RluD [Chitinilyticum litopenaei]|uniref:23S rRNA pseudouridine(1911/1915/1917) synthase RluD n=1 Tax=Chitinilyticum litopenaei TaxID=1121276 RepID=UPI00048EC93D|nr:23S rRNA pseudouridine(1911/1915/1917) synthase RluD [Chitinilyticum litopenaei]
MMHPDYELDDYSEIVDRRVLAVPADCAGMRLDAALAQLLPDFSRSRLAQWIKDGQVTVDGQTVTTPKHKLWGGEALSVDARPDPDEIAFQPEDIPLDVLYADSAILIINKPAGLVVHPGSGNWSGTLLNALLFHYPELKSVPRAGIVHRLDKDTSGLMVVARTLAAQNHLVQQLQARTVKRHYLAVAQGAIASDGTVDAPIGRHLRDRVKMAVVHGGKPAVTHYRVLERFSAHTLVECQLETGRTHQIRVHMAHIGHPLAADSTYNARPVKVSPEVELALDDFQRQALHARKLALVHPESGKTMQWKAPIPQDFENLLAALRFDAHPDDEGDDDWDDEDDDHDCEIIYVRD